LTEDLPVLSAASQQLDHLILVPCHGTFRGYDFTKYLDESQWGFEQFQLGHDMPAILTEHIRKAVELGAQDPASLVLFSGGQSRVDSASRSEGQSYFDLALANNFAGIDELMRGPSADVPHRRLTRAEPSASPSTTESKLHFVASSPRSSRAIRTRTSCSALHVSTR
jgi:hypothetical protein